MTASSASSAYPPFHPYHPYHPYRPYRPLLVTLSSCKGYTHSSRKINQARASERTKRTMGTHRMMRLRRRLNAPAKPLDR